MICESFIKLFSVTKCYTNFKLKSSITWNETQCSSLKFNRHSGGISIFRVEEWAKHKPAEADLISCLASFSTLKIESICSSKTLVDCHWTSWPYIFLTTAVRTSNPANFKVSDGKKIYRVHISCTIWRFWENWWNSILPSWKVEFMFHRCKSKIRFYSKLLVLADQY
jgi:hypothetical protein